MSQDMDGARHTDVGNWIIKKHIYTVRALVRTGAMGAWHPQNLELLYSGTRDFLRNPWRTVAWHP